MKTDGRRSYDDWFKALVYLETCSTISQPGYKLPERVSIEEFTSADQEKIRTCQRDIFNKLVKDKLSQVQDDFTERFHRADELIKETILRDSLNRIADILWGTNQKGWWYMSNKWNLAFENDDELLKIRNYFKTIIKTGKDDPIEIVHSPNFEFGNKDHIQTPVYVRALWKMYVFLNEIKEKDNKDSKTKTRSITTRQWALYLFYLLESKETDGPENKNQTRQQYLYDKGKEFGCGPKNFKNVFYDISLKSRRVVPTQKPNIKIVIDLLSDYPKAKKIAEQELIAAELNPN